MKQNLRAVAVRRRRSGRSLRLLSRDCRDDGRMAPTSTLEFGSPETQAIASPTASSGKLLTARFGNEFTRSAAIAIVHHAART